MATAPPAVGRWNVGVLILALAIVTQAAAAAEPKRVLVFHSFARDGSPMNVTVAAFRRAMVEQSPHEIAFYDADLESGLPPDSKGETAIVESLRARFDSARLDLIVTVSAAATRFYLRHRDELFGNTPVQAMGAEERTVADLPLRPGDGVVGVRSNLGDRIEQILTLLPGTRNVVVVTGDSPQERFWVGQLRKELQRFEGTVTFEWLNGLSLAQMKRRVATLQDGSVVYAGMLYMDAARTPLKRMEVLEELNAISNVPIFGTYEADLGHGIVGGPLVAQVAVGKTAATMALRSIVGNAQDQPPMVTIEPTTPPTYDWRVLQRWNIDEARLPSNSVVKFRPPSVWQQHRGTVTAAIVIVLLETVLITVLVLQRVRMRRAKLEALAMSGRLMTAHEDERRRLARELHDDVTQRLARLAIDAARLPSPSTGPATPSIHTRLAQLGEDVHALSYRLHPSIVEDLGLAEALKAECEQMARDDTIRLEMDICDIGNTLPKDFALCLFRVAQEALHNVARHARATRVTVTLRQRDDGIALSVGDDGVGFDPDSPRAKFSLGHAGMRERVRLLAGYVRIQSAPSRGTSVVAWLPAKVNV